MTETRSTNVHRCANCGARGIWIRAYCYSCERVARRQNRCLWCAQKLPHTNRDCIVYRDETTP